MKKTENVNLMQLAKPFGWVVCSIILCINTSCEQPDDAVVPKELYAIDTSNGKYTPSSFPYSGNLVEVTSNRMNFEMPDEIPAGWTTFRYKNQSKSTHFFLIEKMPIHENEQILLKDWEDDIAPVFQDAMDLINQGEPGEGFAQFARMPAWAGEVIYTGGVGITAPHSTSQVTQYIEPGVYVLECYIKRNGRFHSVDGMAKQLIVTEQTTNASPPVPTMQISISSTDGIEVEGKLRPGLQTIAVHFEDQIKHENVLGHDVHLMKLDDNTDLDEVEYWLNWVNPGGLEGPAPAIFLGGVQEMPAGNTAYMTMVLKPGRYAWVSEVPNASSKGMLKEFTIPAGKK